MKRRTYEIRRALELKIEGAVGGNPHVRSLGACGPWSVQQHALESIVKIGKQSFSTTFPVPDEPMPAYCENDAGSFAFWSDTWPSVTLSAGPEDM